MEQYNNLLPRRKRERMTVSITWFILRWIRKEGILPIRDLVLVRRRRSLCWIIRCLVVVITAAKCNRVTLSDHCSRG